YLSANPAASVRVEGHTDERGTREYNVALADRRAQSVERLLMFQGAGNDQITIISYGEEKPARLGHDETAWSMNRRVELVY
ncbi:MAG: OmpA family protein, partial [Gammaproteobacteria bacterium]|nr:OmpA family protein [Gammaproteobacteria bacterium]